MTHEYDDPFNDESIAAAVERTIALRNAKPETPLEVHLEQAVHESICACAIDIEDDIEQGSSGLHETLLREVRRLVEDRLETLDPDRFDDPDDKASRESFPASDPLGVDRGRDHGVLRPNRCDRAVPFALPRRGKRPAP